MWTIKSTGQKDIYKCLATISNDIKNRITAMGELFVREKIIDPSVLSTDISYQG